MAGSNGWRAETDVADWARSMEKRLMHEERRPPAMAAVAALGPGIGAVSQMVKDWNSTDVLFSGFYCSTAMMGSRNSPNDTKDWVGMCISCETGMGIQQLFEVAANAPGQVYLRTWRVTGQSYVPAFSAWTLH